MLQVLLLGFCCCNDFLSVSGIPSVTYCLPTSGPFFSPLGLCYAWGLMDVTLLIAANTRASLEERARVGWGDGRRLAGRNGEGISLWTHPTRRKASRGVAVGCLFAFFAGS